MVKSPVLPEGVDAAREAAMRLAEKIRSRSIRADVKAADEVKRLGLITSATCTPDDSRKNRGGRGHPDHAPPSSQIAQIDSETVDTRRSPPIR